MDVDTACHFHNMRAPQGILSATLVGNTEKGACDVDITKRVQKYAGFGHKYHGTTVYVKDLFPLDDHDDNVQRFSGVRIMEIHPKRGISTKTYSYKDNESLTAEIKSL